jgi:DNA-binding NarL/FixJ family response regulator
MEAGRARVLVIDDDPQVGPDVKAMLDGDRYEVWTVPGQGHELLEEALKLASNVRPHVAVVDLRLLDSYRYDQSGLKLIQELPSARRIVYSAYLGHDVTRNVRDLDSDWISKEENPAQLVEAIERSARQNCAAIRGWSARWSCQWDGTRVVQALFGGETDLPPATVDDVLCQLFPQARQVILQTVPGDVVTPPPISRRRSIVLKAFPDNLEPVVVKLAPSADIRIEVESYHTYIHRRLGGRFYAQLDRSIGFWDLGGATYGFLDAPFESLSPFSSFYHANSSATTICRPLRRFFKTVWHRHYTESARPDTTPLFDLYNAAFDLERHLSRLETSQRQLTFPGLTFPLTNPVSWAIRHRDQSLIPGTRQAVTHGDLHGDNLFVDAQNAWAIDFERTRPGHILRDFIELEVDITTRLADWGSDEIGPFLRYVCALFAPLKPARRLALSSEVSAHQEALKALKVVEQLRRIASEVTAYRDQREHTWGLLLNAVYVAALLPEYAPQRTRALLLAAVACERLQRWNGSKEWPPAEWGSTD